MRYSETAWPVMLKTRFVLASLVRFSMPFWVKTGSVVWYRSSAQDEQYTDRNMCCLIVQGLDKLLNGEIRYSSLWSFLRNLFQDPIFVLYLVPLADLNWQSDQTVNWADSDLFDEAATVRPYLVFCTEYCIRTEQPCCLCVYGEANIHGVCR